ncbi:BatA domain-containing protein [Roseimarinus sediminis]|uniref:BatA domain-containing protein n=1 Tax=Roseimarinus sediminis TaxID=1610899 RepID=UPI003D238914
MSFIYPSILWALLFVAVPVIIHLLNLRKHRTVYFSNVNLLKKVRKATRKRSKLKQLLILTSRILMIIALVMAFARPYIPSENSEKQLKNNLTAIYIDNSYSMNAEGPEGKAIESARQKAYTIVNNSRPGTRFALLTNALSEQQNRFYSNTEMIRLIADVSVSHRTVPLSTIVMRFRNMTDDLLFESNKSLYVVSDFQKHTSDFNKLDRDTTAVYNLIPVPVNPVNNLYIDSCWYEAPTHHLNQSEELFVRIVNQSDEDYQQVPVNFFLNDSLKALATININAGEQKELAMAYTNLKTGLQSGRIEISDYPITYDNQLYLSYTVKSSLKVLLIDQFNNLLTNNLKALFGNDNYISLDVEQVNRLQISSLSNYEAIVVNELSKLSSGLIDELYKFTINGGTLVLIPGSPNSMDAYNQLLQRFNLPQMAAADTLPIPIGKVAYEHPLYSGVFNEQNQKVSLPETGIRYRFRQLQLINETTLLSFADQSKALTLAPIEKGSVYIFAFPLSDTRNKLIDHLLFLPTFYNIVLQSTDTGQLYYVIGNDRTFDLQIPKRLQSLSLTMRHQPDGDEMIPTITRQSGNTLRLALNEEPAAGFYEILSDDKIVSGMAFNYQLKESDLSYHSNDELSQLAEKAGLANVNLLASSPGKLTETIENIDQGRQFWKLFLVIGLFFILTEAAIIRFWK